MLGTAFAPLTTHNARTSGYCVAGARGQPV